MADSILLDSRFHLDPSVLILSDAAEVALARGLAYCGAAETYWSIPSHIVPTLVREPSKRRVAAVVRELTTKRWEYGPPLWVATSDGYRMRSERPLWRVDSGPWRARIPDAVRQAVYARDGYRCRICGTTEDLTLDHVYPWSLGGSDDEDNLQTMCCPHNSAKGARIS